MAASNSITYLIFIFQLDNTEDKYLYYVTMSYCY